MNEEKRKSFEIACQPLLEWRKKHLCPHDVIVIDASFAEVLNGEFGFPVDLYQKDKEVQND